MKTVMQLSFTHERLPQEGSYSTSWLLIGDYPHRLNFYIGICHTKGFKNCLIQLFEAKFINVSKFGENRQWQKGNTIRSKNGSYEESPDRHRKKEK